MKVFFSCLSFWGKGVDWGFTIFLPKCLIRSTKITSDMVGFMQDVDGRNRMFCFWWNVVREPYCTNPELNVEGIILS